MAVTKNFDLVVKGMGSEAAAAAFRYCAACREDVGEGLYCGQRLQLQLLTSGINSCERVSLRGSSAGAGTIEFPRPPTCTSDSSLRCGMIFSGDRCDLAAHDSQLAHPVDQGSPRQPEAGRRAAGAANHPPCRAECFHDVAALGLRQRAD